MIKKKYIKKLSAAALSAVMLFGTAFAVGGVPSISADAAALSYDSALPNSSHVSSTVITLGQKLTIYGSSDMSGVNKYAYFYKKSSETKWYMISDFTTKTSVTVKPGKAVKYNICVKVKDSKGSIYKKYMDVNVKPALVNNSSLSQTTLTMGQKLKMKAAAKGGSGSYTYSYLYKKDSDTKWLKISDFSDKTSVEIKPGKAVKYNTCIKVKDSNGAITKKYIDFTVQPALVSESYMDSPTVSYNSSVTLHGRASGGSGSYKYAYFVQEPNSSEWIKVSDFSATIKDILIICDTVGDYRVCIKAKDSNGAEVKEYFTLKCVRDITNVSTGSAATITQGETYTITPGAMGGTGVYTYKVYYKVSTQSEWTDPNAGNRSSYPFKMNYSGDYLFKVTATDSQGYSADKILYLTVLSSTLSEEQVMIDNILGEIITNDMTELEKVKAIHDWLVCNTEYDTAGYESGNIPDSSYTVYGLLTTGKAVCDGYAKTFKEMATRAGLDAIRVTGEATNSTGYTERHAWNQVKVDGKWYNIDVTWDDPTTSPPVTDNSNLRYKYFLIPDSELNKDHTPESDKYSCTTPQPKDILEPMIIADELAAHSNYEYCETDADMKAAFVKYDYVGAEFSIIYKSDLPTVRDAFAKLSENRLTYHVYSYSGKTWKLNGYYFLTVKCTS